MESSESPDSKDSTTFSHDAGTSKIKNQVKSSPMISSHSQTNSTGNYQVMADQPRHGNVDEQLPQIEDVNEQKPGSDTVMNPCSIQQAQPNQIANVMQQHRQLLLNYLNSRLSINERQRNGLDDQPPQARPHHPPLNSRRRNATNPGLIRYKTPHFHLTIRNQDWTFNDVRQRVPVRIRQQLLAIERQQLPLRHHRPFNECHELLMNADRLQPICELPRNSLNAQPSQVMPRNLPLVSRTEIEPGIFEEIYSQNNTYRGLRKMFGAPRCLCLSEDILNNVNFNCGNNRMITVIMHTPNLSKRFSMTIRRESRLQTLFNAYFRLTKETTDTVFVAVGKRLRGGDTPKRIGMKNREKIYAFISSEGYVSTQNKDLPK